MQTAFDVGGGDAQVVQDQLNRGTAVHGHHEQEMFRADLHHVLSLAQVGRPGQVLDDLRRLRRGIRTGAARITETSLHKRPQTVLGGTQVAQYGSGDAFPEQSEQDVQRGDLEAAIVSCLVRRLKQAAAESWAHWQCRRVKPVQEALARRLLRDAQTCADLRPRAARPSGLVDEMNDQLVGCLSHPVRDPNRGAHQFERIITSRLGLHLGEQSTIHATTLRCRASVCQTRSVPTIPTDDPVAVAAVNAIHDGDVPSLCRLLADHPELATVRLGGDVDNEGDGGMSRTLLHVVTDWPGHYPNAVATVEALVAAGADVNARFVGPHTETPLHWAASSDDVAVVDALLDAGADIDAPGGVIADGTPLFDAAAFDQWRAARRLIERGARSDLWESAAMGLLSRIEERFNGDSVPTPGEVTGSFWGACHGGQRETAEYLLDRGADLNWIGWDGLTPLDAARRSGANAVVAWLHHQGGRSASDIDPGSR